MIRNFVIPSEFQDRIHSQTDLWQAIWYAEKYLKHSTDSQGFCRVWGGSKWPRNAKNGYFGHFDPLKHPKSLDYRWNALKPEIDLRMNPVLKLRRNDKISSYLEFPLYFSSISYIRYDPFVGGSNDLQMVWNFFPELFMIFLHRKK